MWRKSYPFCWIERGSIIRPIINPWMLAVGCQWQSDSFVVILQANSYFIDLARTVVSLLSLYINQLHCTTIISHFKANVNKPVCTLYQFNHINLTTLYFIHIICLRYVKTLDNNYSYILPKVSIKIYILLLLLRIIFIWTQTSYLGTCLKGKCESEH